MKKPSLYCDTSVISAYWYEGGDVKMLARRQDTREWWDAERKLFSLWASGFGEAELAAGEYRRQNECVKMIRRIPFLTSTKLMTQLRDAILERGLVPDTKATDAVHLAISASHGIDYLLTWNYAHMANASVQERFNSLCEEMALLPPLMVSPESIPQDRFGQSIRRKHHHG